MAKQQPSLGGQLAALGREGLKDLHNAIVPAFPESQRGVDEPGTPLTPTQSMVTDDLKQEPSFEAEVAAMAVKAPQKDKEPELELD